jgi:hypothetical protein
VEETFWNPFILPSLTAFTNILSSFFVVLQIARFLQQFVELIWLSLCRQWYSFSQTRQRHGGHKAAGAQPLRAAACLRCAFELIVEIVAPKYDFARW